MKGATEGGEVITDPPRCATCRWWEELTGDCHRFPPPANAQFSHLSGQQFPIWPHVYSDDYCGEHTPKEEG